MRKVKEMNLDWLKDPRVFAINRLEPVASKTVYIDGRPCIQSLNGKWHLTWTDTVEKRDEDFYIFEKDYHDKPTIQVPGHLETQGYGKIQYTNNVYPWDGWDNPKYGDIPEDYNPTACMVRYFNLDERMRGKRVELVFDGVETAFYVWLNGQFVGYSEDSFTPSRFDVTDLLYETDNKLAVQVHRYSSASWLEDQDMFRFSGIFRDVKLEAFNDIHVRDIRIETMLGQDYKNADLFIDLKTEGQAIYHMNVLDPDGKSLIKFETNRDHIQVKLSNVRLWSAEKPELYTLQVEVFDEEERPVETFTEKFGIREVKIKDGKMMINGKRLLFKGVNRHEFHPVKGRAISKEDILQDLLWLKANNFNAVRTSHYPNNEVFYDLCDELGLYVIDENNLETHGTWLYNDVEVADKPIPGNYTVWKNAVFDRMNNMMERDKNHPSIVMWSLGNESFYGDILLELAQSVRLKDGTRPVHYESSFRNEAYHDTSDVYSRMYPTAAECVEYLKKGNKKPLLLCEYAHSMGNSNGGLYKYTDLEAYENYAGGFIWDFMDQAMEHEVDGKKELGYGGDFDDRPNDGSFSGNGLLDARRNPYGKSSEAKQLYSDIRLTPTRNGVRIENGRQFTDTSDIIFEATALENGHPVYSSKFQALVNPQEYKKVMIPWPKLDKEAVYEVRALRAKDTPYARAGSEISFGQYVCGKYEKTPKREGTLKMVEGITNTGFQAGGFKCLFNRKGMVSLVIDGQEMLDGVPVPVFARAYTENDKGFNFDFHSSIWTAASTFVQAKSMRTELYPEDQIGAVHYEYELPNIPSVKARVTYTVSTPGVIAVDVELNGAYNLPELPAFGIRFPLKKAFDQVKYYGRGPYENYADRKKGTRLGRFETTAAESVEPYLVPTETGNHTDVREVSVENKDHIGLMATAVGKPFEMSVLPWSFEQLQAARHQYELPKSSRTWMTIYQAQMGVGGDDTWGLPVLDEFMLSSREDRSLSFILTKADDEN